ncbi:multicopper oxidase family protein [Acuticoccus sediminis]|uniref:multicopper oxidase family protein n=1 Tax=Acuticoccus sediminis TaxID=2184697 RepID=UPI001CFC8BC2|nr:multicopper oxidase family protein [Acuticoccus sediminis]
MKHPGYAVSRRTILSGSGALLAGAALWPRPLQAASAPYELVADTGRQRLAFDGAERLARTWCYNGTVPGPLLRYRVGDRLDVAFTNRLPEPTSVHWHGLRPPNAMDGAAPLTQPPVAPGETMAYTFDLNDAGTFWYHTHFRSFNQQDRGLYGVLVVDEAEPPAVDRDLVLVLDDWVVDAAGRVSQTFGAIHEWAHAGRLGNVVTMNNADDIRLPVRAGERLRLRLVNVANAQVFALAFSGHETVVIAEDGEPVPPRRQSDVEPLVLAPGQRVDVILDATAAPGSEHAINGLTLTGEISFGRVIYAGEAAPEGRSGGPVVPLAPNARPTLDLEGARRIPLAMEGGAMGRMRGAVLGGTMMNMRELVSNGRVWALNGVAGDMAEPLVTLKGGETVIVEMTNDTAFPHAMHLHGMHFREVEREGRTVTDAPWRDTVLMGAGERVAIAFAGEGPGRWMFHCHMIEHMAGGMMTFVEVEEA